MTRVARAASLALPLLLAASAVAVASGEDAEGHGSGLFYPLLNLLLLIGVLIYFARKPVQAFFAERRDEIQGALREAAELRAEAEARYAQWQRKLAELEADLEGVRATARERAEVERERILADARAAAERIRNDARAAADQELQRARLALRAEAADLAVGLAAERLRAQVDDSDRARLVDEFVARIERVEGS